MLEGTKASGFTPVVFDITKAGVVSEVSADSVTIANDEGETLCGGGLSCGDPDAGSCCNEHAEPFCNNGKCCALVCSFDETCCITEWDTTCVQLAQAFCGCGSVAGDGGVATIDEAILENSVKSGIIPAERLERLEGLQGSAKPEAATKKPAVKK